MEPLRRRWILDNFHVSTWGWPTMPYPGPVQYELPRHRQYSQDLIESHSNPVQKGPDGKEFRSGSNFHVVRRHYSEYCSLCGGPCTGHAFSGSSNPYAPGDHAETRIAARYDEFGNWAFPTVEPSDLELLEAFGRKAIAAVAPTKELFGGMEFLGELKDGLPSFLGFAHSGKERTLRNLGKGTGEEFLNYQFGIKPLIKDVQDMVRTADRATMLWRQYQRRANTLLRRTYGEPTETTVETSVHYDWYPFPGFPSSWYDRVPGVDRCQVITTSTTKRWFVGAFKYFLPELRLGENNAKMRHVWGTEITPKVMWELAPWSWAIDWVTDAGTLMENLTYFNTDGLIMPYAYVMEHKTVTKEYNTWVHFKSYPGTTYLRQTFKTECKRRIHASPWGFGVTLDDLSPTQLAIAAALGLAKLL